MGCLNVDSAPAKAACPADTNLYTCSRLKFCVCMSGVCVLVRVLVSMGLCIHVHVEVRG